MTPPHLAGTVGLLSRKRVRRLLALAAAVGFALILLPLLLLAAILPRAVGAPGVAPGAIPKRAAPWLEVVNAAAEAYDVNPFLLLAILSEETQFGTHPDTYGANFLGCCFGPFQLNVADGTWSTVRNAYRRAHRPATYPRRVSPHPSVFDSFDAACAAAALLRIKVGGRPLPALDANAWRAASGYQGSGPIAAAYADRVLAHARAWARESQNGSAAGARLSWPVPGPVTSPFGPRWGRLHAGIDIGATTGTPIAAAAGGRVTVRGWVGGYGQMICVAHGTELTTCYAHLDRYAPRAVVGSEVSRGDEIGSVGCTGHCRGPHLHFEVRVSTGPGAATAVDPLPYLTARA